MTFLPKSKLWRIVLAGFVLLIPVLVAFFYAKEDLRGKRDWENCKHELEAKGEVLDWNAFVPPPVPNDENIFKAPKISEWFIKPALGKNLTNEFVAQLNTILSENDHSVIIADLTIEPPSTNDVSESDIELRYSSFGTAVFLSAPIETNMSSPNFTLPLIQFEDVPITTAIENLARIANIPYLLDPKIGYNQSDKNEQIKSEPTISLRWQNITARQALVALLNQYDLQLIENSKSNSARIAIKPPSAPQIYISPDAQLKVNKLFQNIIGTNVIGSQGLAFLTKPLAEIKPAHVVLYSETAPNYEELVALFMQFFPNDMAKIGSPGIQIEPVEPKSFQIILNAFSASGYLKRSDKFETDFNKIGEALKRPYARMDGDYGNPITIPIPNYVAVRTVIQILAQRAECFLLINQPGKALDELTLINDSRHLFEGAPTGKPMTLVAALLNVAVIGIYADVVSQGIKKHSWQAVQLLAMEKQLQQINLFPFMANAFREDRATFYYAVKHEMVGTNLSNKAENLHYKNLTVTSLWQQQLIESLDHLQCFIRPGKILEAPENSEAINRFVLPGYSRALQSFVFNQNLIEELQIVCALERYHLARGEYPETLDVLAPKFIEKIPHDIIGGQPLRYHRTNDGKFLLYSIGWNEKDDDGSPGTLTDVKNGDWIWN